MRVALAVSALLAAPASHAQDKTFFVSDAGIGRLTAETRYTVNDVSAALGGLPVKATTVYYRDIAISALEALRDGKRVLLAFKREGGVDVARATAYAPESVTSTGVAMGTPMSEVFEELPEPSCRNGLERQAGLVFCPAPNLENVRFAFRCGDATHGDVLPPADVLARCPLERIIWIASE
ncbi:MAG: DUF1131 family protein [Proteobacteria bacterium]|nr:DUF1131 family protein [Pseudomonadota bacterium]